MTKSLALAPNLGFWKSTLGMKACHHGCVLSVKFIDEAKQTITEVEKKVTTSTLFPAVTFYKSLSLAL